MDRKALIDKLHARLIDWNNEITRLEAKAEQASGEAKRDLLETIEQMKQRKEEARTKIAELQHASDSAWEDIKTGADEALDAIKRSFESAKSKF